MKTGIELIAVERQRQIEEECWTQEHDDQHDEGELALSACVYAMPNVCRTQLRIKALWPFAPKWFKPTAENRIRELQKAGALIAAEIDRLQRLTAPGNVPGEK